MLKSGGLKTKKKEILYCAVWSLLIFVSLFRSLSVAQKNTVDNAVSAARAIYRQDYLYRDWAIRQNGLYSELSKGAEGEKRYDHKKVITTSGGQKLYPVTHLAITQKVYEFEGKRTEIRTAICGLNKKCSDSSSACCKPEAIKTFLQGGQEYSRIIEIDNAEFLKFFKPLKADRQCLYCHSGEGFKEGDIMGVFSLSLPMASFNNVSKEITFWIIGRHFVAFLAGTLGIFFAGRLVRKKEEEKDRKNAELIENKNKFETIVNLSPNAMAIMDVGTLEYLEVNQAFETLTGYDKKAILGKTPFQLKLWVEHEQRERWIAELREKGFVEGYEMEYADRFGRRFTGLVSAKIIELAGKTANIVIIQDISDRKENEELIKNAYNELKLEQKIARIGSWKWSIIDDTFTCSDGFCDIFGISKKEIVGNTDEFIRKYIYGEGKQKLAELKKTIYLEKITTSAEFRILRADGEMRVLWMEPGNITFDENGKPIAVSGITMDITKRKEVENLLSLQTQISEYGLYHNLQELLKFIINKAMLLTQSSLGYFHFVNEDKKTVTLQVWSRLENNELAGYTSREEILQAGEYNLWKECIDKKRVVNKSEIIEPCKCSAVPKEFLASTCEMAIPIIKEEKTIAIIGLADPVTQYSKHVEALINRYAEIVRDIIEKKIFERELILSERKYRSMVETSNEGIISTDKNEVITYTNKNFPDFLDYSEEEILGHAMTEFLFIEDIERFMMRMAKRRNGQNERYEQRFRKKGGEECWIFASATPVFADDGSYAGAFAMVTDFTQRKQAELALQESEERYKALFNLSPEAIIVYKNNSIFLANLAAVSLLKTETIEKLQSGNPMRFIHPDFVEKIEHIRSVILNESIFTGPFYCKLIDLTGAVIEAEVSGAVCYFKGEKVVQTFARNITERVKAENALRESRERNMAILKAIPDMMFIISREGHFLDYHLADINETYNAIGFENKSVWQVLNAESAEMVMKKLAAVEETGMMQTFEYESELNPSVHYETRMVKCGNDGFLAVIRDISKAKSDELAIKKSLEEKETLLRELYHRTKNNMQVINAMLQLQAYSTKDSNIIKILMETGNRIKTMALVHQKLYQSNDLSRVNFKDYIEELITLLLRMFDVDSERIKITKELEEQFILFDYAVPCGLVINEVISNIFKYAFPQDRKGAVVIKMNRSAEGKIFFLLKDNGVGLPRNFDARNSETLGMQLIHTLVEQQLNGKLEIINEGGVEVRIEFADDQYAERV